MGDGIELAVTRRQHTVVDTDVRRLDDNEFSEIGEPLPPPYFRRARRGDADADARARTQIAETVEQTGMRQRAA